MGTESPTLYLGAYAVCVQDDQILLARLCADDPTHPGFWTLPGGGVEFGESPDDAVVRELAEETGLCGRRREVLSVFSRLYLPSEDRPLPPAHVVGLLYRMDVDPGDLVHEVGGSTDQCAWITLEETANLPLVDLARHAVALV